MLKKTIAVYERVVKGLNLLQSPLLLAVRVYWGFQLAQNGWGKLHHLSRITEYFQSLNIPLASINAPFVSGLEFFGGILLMLGLFSRPIALLIAGDMLVAYYTADHAALLSAFSSDPSAFYAAAPYTFLAAAVLVLVFGGGYFSLDTLLAKWIRERA